MSIWLWPLLIVIIGIVLISYFSSVSVTKQQQKAQVLDKGISQKVHDHPFTLNPIIWAYILAAVFSGILIFYYAVVYTF
ncbi:hypothetical protein ACFOZY_02935 [Chungangia koreensis]|uniref:Short-chain dehydrogenase n=1 Tax=Chungangia koreensis TaxID=752657 RepID=A0ABV8X0H6_9LACT